MEASRFTRAEVRNVSQVGSLFGLRLSKLNSVVLVSEALTYTK
jgi:hypothetical protein